MARPVNEFRDAIRLNRMDPIGQDPIKAPTVVFESAEISLNTGNRLRYNAISGDYEVWKDNAWVSITDRIDPTLYQASITSLISGGFISKVPPGGVGLNLDSYVVHTGGGPVGRGEILPDDPDPTLATSIQVNRFSNTGTDNTANLDRIKAGDTIEFDDGTNPHNIYTVDQKTLAGDVYTFQVTFVSGGVAFGAALSFRMLAMITAAGSDITITAGTGRVTDSWTDPEQASSIRVQWADITHTIAAVSDEFGAVAIGVDFNGQLVELQLPLSSEAWRDFVVLGFVFWIESDIFAIYQAPHVANQQQLAFYDYIEFIGLPTRRSGLVVNPVLGQKQIWLDNGRVFIPGGNWSQNRKDPNIVNFAQQGDENTAVGFTIVNQNGEVVGTSFEVPEQWDDNGVATNLTGTQAAIHYVYIIPQNSRLFLQLGQNTYGNGETARNSLSGDASAFTPFPGASQALLIAQIWIEHATTNFTNPDKAGINNSVTSVGGGVAAPIQNFLQLSDTPATYAGHGGSIVKVKDDASGLEFGNAGTAAEQIITAVTQAAHGFQVGDWVYVKPDGTWDKAIANDETKLKVGMVVITAPSSFNVLHYGTYTFQAAHGYTLGATYFLSETTAGRVTDTPPTVAGTFQQACFEVETDRVIKVIDQAVVDNTAGRALAPIGVILPTYAAGQDYKLGDVVVYRGNYYVFTADIDNAPSQPPYEHMTDQAVGSSLSYRVNIAANQGQWVNLCEIDPLTSGEINLSGNGSQFVLTFAATGVRLGVTADYSNEGDIQIQRISVRQQANNQPYKLWVQLQTFARDWLVDFKFIGASNALRPVKFTDPIPVQATEPTATEKAVIDLDLNAASEPSTGGGGGGGVPVGTIITFASLTPPDGYLLCDGSQYDPLLYPDLYTLLQTDHLPDLRNQFVRGASNQNQIYNNGWQKHQDTTRRPRTNFTGSTTGSGSHSHSRTFHMANTEASWAYSAPVFLINDNRDPQGQRWTPSFGGGNHSHGININGGGDNETAPAHVYMAYMIRAEK